MQQISSSNLSLLFQVARLCVQIKNKKSPFLQAPGLPPHYLCATATRVPAGRTLASELGIGNAIVYSVMKNILVCSSNPILVKSLYAILRDEGFNVSTSEHPAFAVQMIMHHNYDFLIMDSEPFGLSAEDAVEIVRTISPDLQTLFIGDSFHQPDNGLDLEEFKKTIQAMAV
jgi:CheY-like chemotaxis protein